MRKGVIIIGEESISILILFIAFAVLLSNFLLLNRRADMELVDERMAFVADNIADYIAKKYVDSKGDVELDKLNITRGNVEVRIGGAQFGRSAPQNANIYVARRLVFVKDQPVLMEVRVWQ